MLENLTESLTTRLSAPLRRFSRFRSVARAGANGSAHARTNADVDSGREGVASSFEADFTTEDRSDAVLSPAERRIALALARAAVPAGAIVPEADEATVDRFATWFAALPASTRLPLRATLWALELGTVATTRRRFSRLDGARAQEQLERWDDGLARRLALRSLLAPLKLARFADRELHAALGQRFEIATPEHEERVRWKQNVIALPELEGDEELEADVIVVGTGAGGAVVAKELAERGLAVAMVEAGRFFDRRDFDGRPLEAMQKMYVGGGTRFTIGNVPILIPSGRTVGGTTTVNSGTCIRPPDRVFHKWRDLYGLKEFTPEAMAPYFERVEAILGVREAEWPWLGGCARVIQRGCDALGYRKHGPLPRNAVECDGQGLCCFGCPTDAKRSTNVTYVPQALQAHATLFCEAPVHELLLERGRVVGVVAEAKARPNGAGERRRLVLRAPTVVLACGTYGTPTFLLRSRLGNDSGQLGKNLSLHPALAVSALFDEAVRGWDAIPQGYWVHEFRDEGMTYEGGFTPFDLFAAAFEDFGPHFTEVMERFDDLALFGFMVEDTSRGRVRLAPGNRPVVTYNVNRRDLAVMKRGMTKLAEIYFAAGARRVLPPVHGYGRLDNLRDLERFRRGDYKASDLSISAYHPLGTARMGIDPRSSVVGPDHAVHGIPGLYIVDGSSVPSSLAANPQVTIMAMATRAAEILADRAGA